MTDTTTETTTATKILAEAERQFGPILDRAEIDVAMTPQFLKDVITAGMLTYVADGGDVRSVMVCREFVFQFVMDDARKGLDNAEEAEELAGVVRNMTDAAVLLVYMGMLRGMAAEETAGGLPG